MSRAVLLVVHTGRRAALGAARELASRLTDTGFEVRVLAAEADSLRCDDITVVPVRDALIRAELVVALGGDGTLLRAAELARPAGVPVLGVNLGRVGFLAEADSDALEEAVHLIGEGRYQVEERMTVEITARKDGEPLGNPWAPNGASVEQRSCE